MTPEPGGRRTPHLGKTHLPEQMSPCISMPRLFTSAPGVWSRVDLGTLLCLALDVGSVVEAQSQPCVEHTWRPFSPHCSFQSLAGFPQSSDSTQGKTLWWISLCPYVSLLDTEQPDTRQFCNGMVKGCESSPGTASDLDAFSQYPSYGGVAAPVFPLTAIAKGTA